MVKVTTSGALRSRWITTIERLPGASLGSAGLLTLSILTAAVIGAAGRLGGAGRAADLAGPIGIVTSMLLLDRLFGSARVPARRFVVLAMVLWWPTVVVALAVDTDLGPRDVIASALLLQPLGSPSGLLVHGTAIQLALIGLLGVRLWRRTSVRWLPGARAASLVAALVAALMTLASVAVHALDLPGSHWLPGNLHLIAAGWLFGIRRGTPPAPRPLAMRSAWSLSAFAMAPVPLVLIARQNPERSSIVEGRLVESIGPWFATGLWSVITTILLGVLFGTFLGLVDRRLVDGGWVRPSFATSFVAVAALGFVTRLATLVAIAPARTDGGDPLFYHSTANILARGGGFPEPLNFIAFENWIPSALHGPLYPVVLSFGSRFGGSTYFDHKFVSVLIGTAVVVATGVVARLVVGRHQPGSRSVSLVAMLLAALYPNLWLVDGVLFPEGLMALLTLGVLWAAFRWRESPGVRWSVAMGALAALAALTRGEGLLLTVLLITPWILLDRRLPVRRRVVHLSLAAAACLAVLAPWMLRNLRSFEEFVPLSTNGNELFVYANCDETYSGKFLGFWLYDCQEQLRRAGLDATGDEAEKSLYWREIGLDYAAEHADELPKVVAARVLRQWDLFRPWQNADFAPIEGRDKDSARAGLFAYYGLAALSVVGVTKWRRRLPRWQLAPLAMVFVSVTLTAAYAYGTTRFRVPAEPLLCVLGALGAVHLGRRWRPRFFADHQVAPSVDDRCFVAGGPIGRPWRGAAKRSWIALGAVATAVGVTLPALFRATGSTMEEGFMLVFPERVLNGDVPNVDFLHLYGPTSLHALAGWFSLFGTTLASERTFGLMQHLLLISALYLLARPWGRAVAAMVGASSTLFVLTPIGLQALAWSGGIGLAAWSLLFALRARHRGRAWWIGAGALAGLALGFRPDLVLALLLALGVLLLRRRAAIKHVLVGAVIGAAPFWYHLAVAGPTAVWRGMFVEPVLELRGGRELPRPPSWDHLDGALQVIGEKFAPWWGLPHIGAPKQLFVWFFLLPVVALAIVVLARRVTARVRGPMAAETLLAAGLLGIGVLPQALQRPDSAHFLWVSCVSWPLLIPALVDLMARRVPRSTTLTRKVTGAGALLGVLVLLLPFYTVRTWSDLAVRSLTGDLDVLEVRRDDRWFYLGDTRPWRAAVEVVDDLDALAEPGERLLVGPVDLRQTAYSDVFFYHLFPELEPATYFIEMDPGLANAEGSRLADDVASADWLILTRYWSGWIEPNDSVIFGSDLPNQVVEESFCLVDSYQADVVRLYRACAEGDGTGPYDPPYQPRVDYAVEVLVPVPPRPDGTCTPTCNGQPAPPGEGFSPEEAAATTARAGAGAP